MDLPVIPTTITVHMGAPGSAAENITVPFNEYIKNVASSEIYPTWPEAALRANILAQISYTLNRIYTEYYRSRGYDFDITSTTQYDHAFTKNGETFLNISMLVDDIFNNYIVRNGNIEPLFAQFCDGVRTQCSGLSQWGSVELANNGYSYLDILKHYYGDDINIITDAPIEDNIPSYPGTPLKRGDFLEEVYRIKLQLNRIGKNYPAIPEIPYMSAAFDAATEEAVKAFQRIFNLTPDGIVGKSTWYKIKEVYAGVKKLSELTSEGLTISEAARIYPRTLIPGTVAEAVRTVQYYLSFISFFFDNIDFIPLTGVYDEQTENAVRAFQQTYGLNPDGIVGRATFNKLTEVYNRIVADLPKDYQTLLGRVYPGKALSFGDTGEDVKLIQENINNIALIDPAVPKVTVNGVFDDATVSAVAVLQAQLGREPSGAVDPIIWSEIISHGSGM